VAALTARLRSRQALLRRLATCDLQTGALNHQRLLELLEEELARAARYGRPLSFVMVDLDRFKRVNDRHGHQAGDHVLTAVAHAIGASLRSQDRLGRYGGEEFGLILPETGAGAARAVAERCRRRIEATPLVAPDGRPLRVTASLGCASYPAPGIASAARLVAAADRALYRAKAAGRNRVAVADPAGPAAGPDPDAPARLCGPRALAGAG
jgi:diguanylate cyclase (GGDEF)-like protein